MEFATGALGLLLPKLGQLLRDEYNLHKDAKKNIEFLTSELESIHAALRDVGEVPPEQLSEVVKVWARDAREVSYDMEDIVDKFLVRVQGTDSPISKKSRKMFVKEMMGFVTKTKIRHDIGRDIKDIKERVKEIAARRDRYKIDIAIPAKTSVDPRIAALYNKAADLVGISGASEELIMRLTEDDDKSAQQTIISVVGFGGLGKTTLAKAVYDKLKGQFDCTAFVPVGRHPDLNKVLKAISVDLGMHLNLETLDERQLIDKLREFLENKRYFIVIDDIWETESWEIVKLAFVENNRKCRIVITTRNHEVAGKAGKVYKLQPLSDDDSRMLFLARIFGVESKSSDRQSDDEVSDKILKKCGGIPLAIITMASLLAGKPREEWSEVYHSISFANKGNHQVENTEKIISFSYYDLPSHLRTCLLYLSVFPEDYFIEKSTLVWMWIAEGFIQERQGMSSFEIGEGYFNELVNRSMIQMVVKDLYEMLCGCQVHDMVLDLIRSISYEENFVTILDKNEGAPSSSSHRKVRRLALQSNRPTLKTHMDMQLVRSFISWNFFYSGSSLLSLKLVRVLALHNSYFGKLQVPLRNLHHLRYLGLRVFDVDELPVEEIGSLKSLQTLAVERTLDIQIDGIAEEHVVTLSVGLLTKLLCLRIGGRMSIVPDGIGKLTSLQELQISYQGQEEQWWQFVKELCGLRELRLLHLDGTVLYRLSMDVRGEVKDDAVLQLLRNLQKLEILSLSMRNSNSTRSYVVDTDAWEAEGFLLPWRLRQLSLRWIRFSQFKSFCISPSCLPQLSQLSLHVDAMDEQDLRILGGLPQLRFLDLEVYSTTKVVCNNTRADDDACCLFQKLRRCSIWYREGVRLLLPSHEDSGSVSFRMRNVRTSMRLGSEKLDTVCRAAGVARTPMPSFQELSFDVYVQEFIKDMGNHDDGCVSLALEYFASLRYVQALIDCDGETSAAEVEQLKAALLRAADAHPNRPTLKVIRTVKARRAHRDQSCSNSR